MHDPTLSTPLALVSTQSPRARCLSALVAFLLLPAPALAAQVPVTCNNTTTDDETINAAVASSAAGDELVLSGPCLVNATLRLRGERAYRGGEPSGTVIRQANGANLAALMASDTWLDAATYTGDPISVKNLTLDGNAANNTGRATDGLVVMSWNSTVENLRINSMRGSGIRLTNTNSAGVAITNTQVNGRIVHNFISDSGQHGVYVQDSGNSVTDWDLIDNWIADSGVSAIRLENAAGWKVRGNHLYGVGQTAIVALRLFGTTLSDNYIEGFGEGTTTGTWAGISATVQGDAASVISDNKIFNFGGEPNTGSLYHYLSIAQVNYGTGFVSVTGNAIRGPGTTRSTGLRYDKGGGTALTVVSTGNLVTGVASTRVVGTGVTVTAGQ
ncbi:right-handed parallel beta-helix repeat-containing protein [Myxococcus stipitatus]|uniref:right-handed parallel beta-helix repeat-containing protein n=1 Tax=Myxococcus stipitatus TaxID=83455 RepID=UPI001F1F540C|nr:right-handed parallel beta-helix repeat-containing protein [Myxococcus stipitatus]MCE9672777.1 right-handed parallel beta-helix repeat-containing protein [Myxococcus stipitatus]